MSETKRALLVGCNYQGSPSPLNGCVNDVWKIKEVLESLFGFDPENIIVMIDTDPEYTSPTGKNIKGALTQIVEESIDDDVMVFHYSGHGIQIADDDVGEEADGKDEAICPTDMNFISDDDLRDIFSALPDTVRFTMIADCCHSGSILDHPEQQISGDKNPNAHQGAADKLMEFFSSLFNRELEEGEPEVNRRSLDANAFCEMFNAVQGLSEDDAMSKDNLRTKLTEHFGSDSSVKVTQYMAMYEEYADTGDEDAKPRVPGTKPPVEAQLGEDKGVLITGCQSFETSADYSPTGNPEDSFGAMTNALCASIRAFKEDDPDEKITYVDLVRDVRAVLLKSGFRQNPCLECSDNNATAYFIC